MSIVDRIDPAFGHWLAGFVDGEGCFYLGRVVSRKNGVEYVNYRCGFTLSLREDDRHVLEEIHAALGFGWLLLRKPRETTTFQASGPMLALQITNKADVLHLVELFDRYPLRAKKARDYALWRQAVLEWNTKGRGGGRHRGRHDWSLMERLHQEIKQGRKYHRTAQEETA